jgi:hypothetical protein
MRDLMRSTTRSQLINMLARAMLNKYRSRTLSNAEKKIISRVDSREDTIWFIKNSKRKRALEEAIECNKTSAFVRTLSLLALARMLNSTSYAERGIRWANLIYLNALSEKEHGMLLQYVYRSMDLLSRNVMEDARSIMLRQKRYASEELCVEIDTLVMLSYIVINASA